MKNYTYIFTDGTNSDFVNFSYDMEAYYNRLVGGEKNRRSFIPHNTLDDIHDVIIVYEGEKPVACAGYKEYDEHSAEVKRVWVSERYRGQGISKKMMEMLEVRMREDGYTRIILQTRESCIEAVNLYTSMGYCLIANYPPYENMEQAVCYGKQFPL